MAENTKIEWTDHTFNPWEGCQKVGPGCDNCYAETRNARFAGGEAINWGPGAPRRRTSISNWNKPLKWNKQAELQQAAWDGFKKEHPDLTDDELIAKGFIKPRRPRVFCASLADVFDNAVRDEWRADLFTLIRSTPNLDWLLLTKRIGNAKAMIENAMRDQGDDAELAGWPGPNVWLGATIVNQPEADRDIHKLLAVPAKVHFLSMEPLLEAVDLTRIPVSGGGFHEFDPIITANVLKRAEAYPSLPKVDWVIVGGESGPGARPMHPEWARSLRDQCEAAGVPFLFKQWGEWVPYEHSAQPPYLHSQHGHEIDGHTLPDFESGDYDPERSEWRMDWADMLLARKVGKRAAGRLLDGRTWDGFPKTTI